MWRLYIVYVNWKSFLKMSDALETANCSFTVITHISEKIY